MYDDELRDPYVEGILLVLLTIGLISLIVFLAIMRSST